MQQLRLVLLILAISTFALSSIGKASTSPSLVRFEGFGNIAFQDIGVGGKSYGGGLTYAPEIPATENFAVKPYLGAHMLKATDKEIYPLMIYGAMAQFRNLVPVIFDVGPGLATSFRKGTPTRFTMAGGIQYQLPTPLFGIIDRLVASVLYTFESSNLIIVTYGASINF